MESVVGSQEELENFIRSVYFNFELHEHTCAS